MKNKLAIVTPTYNRGRLLKLLYESLRRQRCCDFTWYVIDDGSTDETAQIVGAFEKELFGIVYLHKENGGKHTALNAAFDIIEEELTFIVDSDDWLDECAVGTILADWKIYGGRSGVAGLSYHRMHPDGKQIGDPYPADRLIDTYINVRVNGRVRGDSAEVYRTEVLRENRFPEIPGEKFMSEEVVWIAVGREYKLVFRQKAIYYCEYRNDGLSSRGRALQLANPRGTLLHALAHMDKPCRMTVRLKYGCMYTAVAAMLKMNLFCRIRASGKAGLMFICWIPGLLLGWRWSRLHDMRNI